MARFRVLPQLISLDRAGVKRVTSSSKLDSMSDSALQRCIRPGCAATADLDDTSFQCPKCGGLLDVAYDWDRLPPPKSLRDFEAKWARRDDPLCFSGVWRFRELLPFAPPDAVVTIGEGQTILQKADALGRYVGMDAG